MRCLVEIPWMFTTIALGEAPGDRDGLAREGLEVVEGAWVEIPPDIDDWPTDDRHLAERTLGRCRSNPKHYRIFITSDEAERSGYDPTGLGYGGAYSPAMWARFAAAIPAMKAFHEIPDDDPAGAVDRALGDLRRAR